MNRFFIRLISAAALLAQLVPAAVMSQAALPQALAQTAPATPPPTAVNNPPLAPHQVLVFPQRDFVSASGYSELDIVQVRVIHPDGTTISTDNIQPQPDPLAAPGAAFAGIVDVNHPGGACWPTVTPDIRPGDRVQVVIVGGPNAGPADETTVANVTAQRPVLVNPTTVAIHGTAVAADGVTPLPPDQLEQRLVAPKDIFDLNGRRTLRATAAAGADGTLSYDVSGSVNWTATYSGLSAADVTRALGAESRIFWRGINPVAAVEGTIYEIGAGIFPGPARGCTAPLEKLPPPPGSELIPPSTPTLQSASVSGSNTVTLTWTAATDNVGVTSYGVYRDGVAIFNVDGATLTYNDVNVPAGTYLYQVDAADAVGNRSALSNGISATTSLSSPTLPAGTVVHEPPAAPVQIISFPRRDFISSSGFLESDAVTVQVIRNGLLVSTASGVIPQADPRAAPNAPFAGIVEVNHPGGACWEGVTPDLRQGDIVRTIAYNRDGSIRSVDQTTSADMTVQRPTIIKQATPGLADGIIEVHGTAMAADGGPIPAAQLTQRLVANKDAFDLNGRRTLRAGGAGKDGELVYDANDLTGTHFTATFTGLSGDDVARAVGGVSVSTGRTFVGAQSRILRLGLPVAAATEITIWEEDQVNGPALPACQTPSEPFDTARPSTPTLQATSQALANQPGSNKVGLTWTAATDNVYVWAYRVYRDGAPLRNVSGATTSYLDTNVPTGAHTYTVDAADSSDNRSLQSTGASINMIDVTPPSVPLNVVATAGTGQVALSWSASTDDVGVTLYGIYRGGVKLTDVPAPTTSYTDSGLALGTYSYTVDAADAAGNRSAQSAAITANVTANADALAPTVPTNLVADTRDVYTGATAPAIGTHDVKLSWTASADNVGVTGYGVYRRNTIPAAGVFDKIIDIPASASPTYTDTPASIGTYEYAIDAFDSAGNRSAQSVSRIAVTVNDPPTGSHSILPFPQRDFVSSTGYALSEGPVTVSVIRGGHTVATSTAISPVEDPATPGLGLVEVNHPGGGCWFDATPNLLPGDIVRYTNAAGLAEQTRTRRVDAYRAIMVQAASPGLANGSVEIHGRAFNFDGTPMAAAEVAAQVQNRLIANRDLFDLNGRRTLRAGGPGADGALSYNAATGDWVATYSNLTANDVARAVGGAVINGDGTVPPFPGAESRGLWLGLPVAAPPETTLYEDGDGVLGGPVATGTCTSAPREPSGLTSLVPTSLTFSQNVGTTSSQTVSLTNSGNAPLTVSGAALSGVYPGDYAITTTTCLTTLAVGASCTTTVSFTPRAIGDRIAALEFQSNAGDTPGVVPLNGKATNVPAPVASLSPTSLTFPGTVVGATSAPQTVTLSNTGNAPLTVTSATFSGPFALNTAAGSDTCSGKSIAAGGSCTVSVVFKPTATGAASGTLSFADNAGTQTVALSGSGAAQPVATPSRPALAAASDSGVVGDNITRVNTPTFTGTAPAGTTVSILSDGVSVGSAATTGTGTYSVVTSVLADGNHVITAQAKDAAGTLSLASAGLNVTIDTVAPVASAPQSSLSSGMAVKIDTANFANSSIPVTLTWSGTDAGSIASYQLQQKKDTFSLVGITSTTTTGTFAPVATPAANSTSVTLDLALGQMLVGKPVTLFSYTFQVLACDVAGNCGTFTAAPKFQMIPVDDSLTGPLLNGAGSIGYSGSWTSGLVTGAYNGNVHFTTAVGANARLNNVTFNVNSDVVWVSTKGPDRGIATVSVDGVATTVDLYAPTAQPAQVVFATRGLRGATQHSVVVTSTGTRNAASTGVRVDMDSFMAIH